MSSVLHRGGGEGRMAVLPLFSVALAALLCLASAGCDDKSASGPKETVSVVAHGGGDSATSPAPGDGEVAERGDAAPADTAAPAQPGRRDLYRRAFEKAQKEITVDNAYERLRQIERAVDADRQKVE